MKDALILELFWKRDEAAIEKTQEKYGAYLMKVAYSILADPEDSQEAVNDTYLAAWNSIPPNCPSVLSTYLRKMTRQLSIDILRKKCAVKRYVSEYTLSLEEIKDSLANGSTPEQELDAKLLSDAINRFLRKLPKEKRNVFVARYYFFDSVNRIAEYCGMTEAKVKTMLFRTRQELKEHLRSEGFAL